MKQTDILRRERELKRAQKKAERLDKDGCAECPTVGEYINQLHALFFHDVNKIYNIQQEDKILELMEDIKDDHPEKQWDNIIRKAVKKTGVKDKEDAVKQLKELME
ncbi:MAG: hypothetical protein JEY99_10145 [Spirochaetales bacterium]|nr:hypothetical protein [Spirochaetales bacterium]